jgi:hypothetical protein
MKRRWLVLAVALLIGTVLAVPGWRPEQFAAAQ